MTADAPLISCICGFNGAGKSKLKDISLGNLGIPFINADDIERTVHGGASALQFSYEAAILAQAQRQLMVLLRKSFAFETVLSDPHGAKVSFLREAREAGYRVVVHFVGLESAELSRARVIQRVEAGGHDVPDEKIAARYPRVMENLRRLLDVPDDLVIYDNSSFEQPYRVVARLERGRLLSMVTDIPTWLHNLDLLARITPETTRLS